MQRIIYDINGEKFFHSSITENFDGEIRRKLLRVITCDDFSVEDRCKILLAKALKYKDKIKGLLFETWYILKENVFI